MADKYQTQCPHCGVKFQITAQQLALANGTVRCGSCLQVFHASQNLIPLTENAPPAGVGSARSAGAAHPPTSPPAGSATPQPPRAPTRPAAPPRSAPPAADGDLADMILREFDEKKAPPAKPARPATPPAAPAPPRGAPGSSWGAPPPAKPTAAPGQSWGAPPPPPPPKSAVPRYAIEENKTKISIGAGEVNDKLLDSTHDPFGISGSTLLADHELGSDSVDESWAKTLIGEGPAGEKDEMLRKFQIKADELSMAEQTGVQKRSALADHMSRMPDSGVNNSASAAMQAPQNRTSQNSISDGELDFLNDSDLTMQDVELPGLDTDVDVSASAASHQVSWQGDVLWATLSAVFALVLLGQYFVFNMDTLARNESWRGLYEVACGAIGCQLPGSSDITRLQGANLVIRSHPGAGQALIVDAVVYNRAPFAQPFPHLELGFSDAKGQPVAGRVFTPAEYLKGELAGTTMMPPDTPIHLTLELVDPGPAAANYEMRFLPPDAS